MKTQSTDGPYEVKRSPEKQAKHDERVARRKADKARQDAEYEAKIAAQRHHSKIAKHYGEVFLRFAALTGDLKNLDELERNGGAHLQHEVSQRKIDTVHQIKDVFSELVDSRLKGWPVDEG